MPSGAAPRDPRSSYLPRFSKDSFAQVGSQGALENDIHFPPEEILQSHEEARVVHETAARHEVDKQVNIAVRPRFAPSHGPEDTDIPRSEAGCDLEDLASLGPDVVRHSH